MRVALSVVALTAIYLLVLGSLHPWDIAIGGLLSAAMTLVFHRFVFGDHVRPLRGGARRLIAFVPFLGGVMTIVVRGTWTMFLTVLGFRRQLRPGIIEIPIGERTPGGVAVTAFIMTLSPGSVVLDIDWERRVMLFHEIDVRDEQKVRAQYEEFYQRWQQRVFP